MLEFCDCANVFGIAILAIGFRMVSEKVASHEADIRLFGQRVGFAAFLLYGLRVLWLYGLDIADLICGTVRAAALAFLAVGVTITLVTPTLFVFEKMRWWRQRDERKRKAADEECRTNQRAEQRQRDQEAMAEQRERSERAQKERLARERKERSARERLRSKCRLHYEKHCEALQTSISRERFAALLDEELGDHVPIEEAKKRAAKLKKILADKAEANVQAGDEVSSPYESLNEITERFEAERDEILSSTYDEITKDSLIADLNREEDRAVREYRARQSA